MEHIQLTKLKVACEKLSCNAVFVTSCLILLVAPFFQPDTAFLWGVPHIVGIYFYARTLSMAAIFTLFICFARRDIFSLLALALSFIVLVSCAINEGDLRFWFDDWAMITSAVLLVAWGSRRHLKELLWAVMVVATVLSVCDIVSYFLFPAGIYGPEETRLDHFFFGHRNAIFNLVIPAAGCSLLLDALNAKRVSPRPIVLALMGLFQVFWNYSATTSVAMIFIIALVVLFQWRMPRRLLNGLTVAVGGVGVFLVLVIFRLQDACAVFITQVLGRSVTFTGRTYVWDRAIDLAAQEPLHTLLGFGPGANAVDLLSFNGLTYYHTHNEVLWLWFTGGIMALVVALAMVALVVKSLYQTRASYVTAVLVAVTSGLAVILLMEISEGFCTPFFLALAYYVPKIRANKAADNGVVS